MELGKNSQVLINNLETLRQYAEKCGASDAVVIQASQVPVDPRVRFKCLIPACYSSGTNAYCPPHGMPMHETKSLVDGYEKAVLFRVIVKKSIVAAESLPANLRNRRFDKTGNVLNMGANYALVLTIAALLKEKAQEMGYDPFGFVAGTCQDVLCHFQSTCRKLMSDQGCRHEKLGAPSLESCGIDAYRMATQVGWDIYPIGGSVKPSQIPYGFLMGLVLVA